MFFIKLMLCTETTLIVRKNDSARVERKVLSWYV